MGEKERLAVWLTSISVITLFVSNLLATKLTVLAGIAVDCGIILYPISYIVGDLSIEFLGKRRADLILYASALLNIIAAALLIIATALPTYPGWENQVAFATIFNFMPRVVAGSAIAYLTAGLVNNYVFERIRASDSRLSARFILSSAIAHLVDSVVFETVAFIGVLSLREFLAQAAFAYLAGFALEYALFYIATKPICQQVNLYLHQDPG